MAANPLPEEDELAPYVILDTELEGLDVVADVRAEPISHGAYGVIYKVWVNGVPCIAKRIHDIFLGAGGFEAIDERQMEAIVKKFRLECVTLSKLRHPNIVQFLGVHYGNDPVSYTDLTLVMELMHTDLETCLLRGNRGMPMPTCMKHAILLDVSFALQYLHTRKPRAVCHRDLTARNVLLTADMRAKLGDFGVSKALLPSRMSQLGELTTLVPGNPVYMPPESKQVGAHYDTALDIYSLGILCICTITEEFPDELEAVSGTGRGVVSLLNSMCQENERLTKGLVVRCVATRPEERPSAQEVSEFLRETVKLDGQQQHVRTKTNRMDILQLRLEVDKLQKELAGISLGITPQIEPKVSREDYDRERREKEEAVSTIEILKQTKVEFTTRIDHLKQEKKEAKDKAKKYKKDIKTERELKEDALQRMEELQRVHSAETEELKQEMLRVRVRVEKLSASKSRRPRRT